MKRVLTISALNAYRHQYTHSTKKHCVLPDIPESKIVVRESLNCQLRLVFCPSLLILVLGTLGWVCGLRELISRRQV